MESACSPQPSSHVLPPVVGQDSYAMQLNKHACTLQQQFLRTDNLNDIDTAIAYHRKALHQLIDEDDVNMPVFLNDLGCSLYLRFQQSEDDISVISDAISQQRKAVQLTSDGGIEMPLRLNNLGRSLLSRFRRKGDLPDVVEAIAKQREAVRLAPNDHVNMPTYLCDLGKSLSILFHRTGKLNDINEAIEYQQRAISLADDSDPEMPRFLNSLGTSFTLLSDASWDMSTSLKGITYLKRAVRLAPDGHKELPLCLGNLGLFLSHRFLTTGDPSEICDAVLYLRKAVHLLPEGHPAKARNLLNLGGSLTYRFQRLDDISDISEAITSIRQAVQLTPENHARLPFLLSDLSNALERRFLRVGDMSDLSEAILHQRKTVSLAPKDCQDMPYFLNALGTSLQNRFRKLRDDSDIMEATDCHRKALDLQVSLDNPSRYFTIFALGRCLLHRFEITGDITDISDSITYLQHAIQHTADGEARKFVQLEYLAKASQLRFNCTADPADIAVAMASYHSAAKTPGSPLLRLQAAKKWAQISHGMDPSQSLEAYGLVIRLVSQVAGLEQSIQKRHSNLSDISDLTTSAAAVAIKVGRIDLALEWLEQGRCVVWSQLNNLRVPLDGLHGRYPDLSDEIRKVSKALEKAGSRTESEALGAAASVGQKMHHDGELSSYVKLAQEWDQLIASIDDLPEFEGLFRPLSWSKLSSSLPKIGVVVVINVQRDRCDAIALTSDSERPLHIPLDRFSYGKAENLRERLQICLGVSGSRYRGAELYSVGRGMRLEQNNGLIGILRQLWDFVVKPILIALRITELPSKLARIWWCATGPLAFLPIHAAGTYDGSAGSSIADFVVSSYTPTIRVLVERTQSSAQVDKERAGLFMISQPFTPKMPPIPATVDEARVIQEMLTGHGLRILCQSGDTATVSEGLANMEFYSCIHLACHAIQDTEQPLKSGFFLHDGRLELSSIIQKRLLGVDLAFLSACQTSAGDEKLSEEAVHLAAGMIAAGYRGVVATMWSIMDRYGPVIAEDFYASLVNEGGNLDGENAAHALHYATQKLRKTLGDSNTSLLAWVPYVHFGL